MSRLRFGIFLPPHQFPVLASPAFKMKRNLEIVKHLDGLPGFEEIWVGEHHGAGGVELICDPLIFIGHASAQTSRIKFGTGVVSLPYHNPLHVAERFALLDQLTMGRVMLGVGPGASPLDAAQIGLDAAELRPALEVDVKVLLHFLTSLEPISVETSRYKLVDAQMQMGLYSDPMPEIVVSALVSSSGPKLAGDLNCGMLSIGSTTPAGKQILASHWDVLEQAATRAGHVADRSKWRVLSMMHLAETREQAREDVRHGIKDFFDFVRFTPMSVPGDTVDELVDNLIESGGAVIGTYQDAIEHIEHIIDLTGGGFGYYLNFDHNWAKFEAKKHSYDLFSEHVISHFHGSGLRGQISSVRTSRLLSEATAAFSQGNGAPAPKFYEKSKADIDS